MIPKHTKMGLLFRSLMLTLFLFPDAKSIIAQHSIEKTPVIITTDVNHAGGDPDDKQSLIHLLWHADQLDIRAIIPERWTGQGFEATMDVIDAYSQDLERWHWDQQGFPNPDSIRARVGKDLSDAKRKIVYELELTDQFVYVLVWGNMKIIKDILFEHPELSKKVRLLTIGTGLKYGPRDEVKGDDCDVPNWNGSGRNEFYLDDRFRDIWWVENNWTYNGMFMGEGPSSMLDSLATFGSMGHLIKYTVKDHDWAQYFRVGDTPSVLYLLDKSHDPDHPEQTSWAGKFKKPFPKERPNYYTDDCGDIAWDYKNPCNSWQLVEQMYAYNKSTLYSQREEMYQQLLMKLHQMYD
jgi:hypothetical protein